MRCTGRSLDSPFCAESLVNLQYIEMLRRMVRIRLFEERAMDLHKNANIPGPLHVSIGQEATAVGACMALRDDDYMTGNHRSHGYPIAKGVDLKPLMAELMGKATGVCGGKGGSMHLADFSVGSLGESGIVAGGIPIATGAGLSAKLRNTTQLCLSFFGDGAVNAGTFHEAINLGAAWKLPVIYFCENNGYAVSAAQSETTAGEHIVDRAGSYGIPGVCVDGQDVLAVHEAVLAAADRARAGGEPTLIEARTYRFRGHAEFGRLDYNERRSVEEVAALTARDPISLFARYLTEKGHVSEAGIEAITADERLRVDGAVAFAVDSPQPSPDALLAHLYAGEDIHGA
jgi:TPP-dependent pyruvate/acetoin dehydrogenase alpha subunit